jgi:hypothetical protein
MKIAYMSFVSNGFDDHYLAHVCSGINVRDFHAGIVRDYWKASSWLQDAVGPYIIAVDLDTLQTKPLGLFKLEKDGKLYAQTGRGEYSGKPESPDDLREMAERKLSEE